MYFQMVTYQKRISDFEIMDLILEAINNMMILIDFSKNKIKININMEK